MPTSTNLPLGFVELLAGAVLAEHGARSIAATVGAAKGSGGSGDAQNAGAAPAGAAGKGGYASPVRKGSHVGRIDEGVDFGSGPNYAVGDGVIEAISHNFYKGLPYIVLKLDHPVTVGGRRYDRVYYAEQLRPHVSVGARVRAGQVIAETYGSNEIGFAAGPSAGFMPAAKPHYSEGKITQEGRDFLAFIKGLGL